MAEIILIGTFHYPERFDIFLDDVQQEIETFTDKLAALQPTKIAVEFPYKLQGELDKLYAKSDEYRFIDDVVYGNVERYGNTESFRSVNEIVQIGFRLGKKLNHARLYGIDEEIELSDELFEKILSYIDMNKYLDEMGRMIEGAQSIESLYAVHNSEVYIRTDNEIYLAMNKVNLGNYEGSNLVLQWYERNLKIFSNLQNICDKEDRVLVLIGSSHVKILKDLVKANFDMEMREW